MKKILLIALLLCFQIGFAQVLNGTLTVNNGSFNITQDAFSSVTEAGLDDTDSEGRIETIPQDNLIGFVLNDSTGVLGAPVTSEQNCTSAVYLYQVYIHTTGAPVNAVIEARTQTDSGVVYPPSIVDILNLRSLTPNTVGADADGYIPIPNNASQAQKVFEFRGCRTDIPIQFRVSPSVLTPGGNSSFQVFYTITATIL